MLDRDDQRIRAGEFGTDAVVSNLIRVARLDHVPTRRSQFDSRAEPGTDQRCDHAKRDHDVGVFQSRLLQTANLA